MLFLFGFIFFLIKSLGEPLQEAAPHFQSHFPISSYEFPIIEFSLGLLVIHLGLLTVHLWMPWRALCPVAGALGWELGCVGLPKQMFS